MDEDPLIAELEKADEANALDKLADAHQAMDEYDELLTKLRDILEQTAQALKGPPPKGVWHDWSDLPNVAAEIMAEQEHLRRFHRLVISAVWAFPVAITDPRRAWVAVSPAPEDE